MAGKRRHANDRQKRKQIDDLYLRACSEFPEVPEITAKETLDRLEAGERLVLVDVRTPNEQKVSMIPSAITVEQYESDPSHAERNVPVVCYCTIGGRSGRYTRELCSRGVNALNMPGAILAWSHAGGEFEGPDGRTRRVHVYNRRFNLLADGYEAVY